ncbi:hypothetical protein INR49_008618 [Caranx melampygus]|nr:hypothetical protein INR49_008618 [Caranx melampygus]
MSAEIKMPMKKRGRGGEKKRRGLPCTQARNNLHIPASNTAPSPLRPSEVYSHLRGEHPEEGCSPWVPEGAAAQHHLPPPCTTFPPPREAIHPFVHPYIHPPIWLTDAQEGNETNLMQP